MSRNRLRAELAFDEMIVRAQRFPLVTISEISVKSDEEVSNAKMQLVSGAGLKATLLFNLKVTSRMPTLFFIDGFSCKGSYIANIGYILLHPSASTILIKGTLEAMNEGCELSISHADGSLLDMNFEDGIDAFLVITFELS